MNEPTEPALDLPDLQDTVLDAATLDQLASDLEGYAQVLEVRTKGGATARTDAAPVSLRGALAMLASGSAFGVQVRYLYEGVEWRDTLMRTPGGTRLVRMQMPTLP